MGWVYNLKTPDPHSQVPRVIAICLVFPIVAFLAVLLRLYVRIHTKRAGWVDDYAALFSSILAIAYGAIAIAQSRWGLGLNAKYFPKENVVPFSRVQYVGGPVYTLALLGFKVSLLASYLRIGGFVKAYRIVIIAVIVACVCNQLAFTFVLCFACRPIARQWDMSIQGSCIDTVASYYGTSLAFDCIIIALPLPVLITLRLQRRQKAALVAVFALGFFVTIIQIIRIFTIKNLKTYTDSQPIVLWSVIEISLGVIISCIPTYGPLFHSLHLTSTHRRRHPDGYRSQSYRLTSPSNRPTGYIHGSGSRPFDSSIPATTTIMSTAVERERERDKVSSDGDSEERILAPCAHMNPKANSHPRGQRSESETTLAELKGMSETGIHTMTEVRVESHSVKGCGWTSD
ncbi:putative integral membrane protein (Pth11) [Aspergillus fischeri NRRL 181]|uniref:Rhodopsin domain-containing protein n=1 Tax=Neosartorya fischeri (strain ATCC 1020 / DSM 3700 / CBS 544.65 / FGSC A1164 / JCM 1740 / NRRL 181 / WB 181) TaxID=331117 RepID=A1DLJ8_NEOFI|nr:conserved hypothetical protein [Aspergillus fischeri NRRL 181]EAW15669.1 conserved hypothetical protein [Aspergillus fischeri NRRL 181]